MDIESLRANLELRRGDWTRIAEVAGLNRKTIQRIVDDPAYNLTLATFSALQRALSEAPAKAA